MTQGTGAKDDPWSLTTPPGTSAYTMFRDEDADPPALVCQVGSTTLSYRLQAIEDLHAWLLEQGDWVALGAADENKEVAAGTVEAWGRSPITRSEAGTGCAKGTEAASPSTCHRSSSGSGWPRSPTTPATTACGASRHEHRHEGQMASNYERSWSMRIDLSHFSYRSPVQPRWVTSKP